MYALSRLILQKQYTPIIGHGLARWNYVHVHDLSELYLLLTEAAVNGNTDKELWGEKGYLIVESGEHVWGDVARAVGKKAVEMGLVASAEEKAFSKDQALETAGFEAISWGLNSRGRGLRAGKTRDWKPKMKGLYEEIPVILREENERLKRGE